MGPKLTPSSQAGFSLIELLVAVAVLSVLTVGAVLATGRGGPDQGSDMARFEVLFDRARALAIEGRQARGLVITPDGVQMAQPGAGDWQVSRTVLPWQNRVAFLAPGARTGLNQPDIRLLPNGRSTVFSIEFDRTGRCESDGWTGVSCNAR